jgi:hypothetical protein
VRSFPFLSGPFAGALKKRQLAGENAGHNVERNAFVTSASHFACAKPATEPSTIQPITLINMVHFLFKTLIRATKKSRRNPTPAVFDCVGLLINGSSGGLAGLPFI